MHSSRLGHRGASTSVPSCVVRPQPPFNAFPLSLPFPLSSSFNHFFSLLPFSFSLLFLSCFSFSFSFSIPLLLFENQEGKQKCHLTRPRFADMQPNCRSALDDNLRAPASEGTKHAITRPSLNEEHMGFVRQLLRRET